jgi:hypothetical protein
MRGAAVGLFTLFTLCLTALTATTVAAPAAPSPWLGRWRLDPARSTRAASSSYKRVTLTIEPAGDGLRVLYDMVGTRGGVTHLEWTGRFDGHDYAVQGADAILTNAYRPVDDRSYAIAVKVDGIAVASAVAAVSPDGRTLTVRQRDRDAHGAQVTTTAVYDRV